MVSAAKKFLQEKYQKRAENFLENAAVNLQAIELALEAHRASDKDEIMTAVKSFLGNAERAENLKLELPSIGLGLLSNIMYNCALYAGNMQQAQKLQEAAAEKAISKSESPKGWPQGLPASGEKVAEAITSQPMQSDEAKISTVDIGSTALKGSDGLSKDPVTCS